MTRNMDLIRLMLLEIEKADSFNNWLYISVDGYSDEQIQYHSVLLAEAGFIRIKDNSTKSGIDIAILSLTWEGHEFLDKARDETIWKKAKTKVGKNFATISIEVMKTLLTQLIKEKFGLPE